MLKSIFKNNKKRLNVSKIVLLVFIFLGQNVCATEAIILLDSLQDKGIEIEQMLMGLNFKEEEQRQMIDVATGRISNNKTHKIGAAALIRMYKSNDTLEPFKKEILKTLNEYGYFNKYGYVSATEPHKSRLSIEF
jgi:hypothetical protein